LAGFMVMDPPTRPRHIAAFVTSGVHTCERLVATRGE
jgi:hypothetical protein